MQLQSTTTKIKTRVFQKTNRTIANLSEDPNPILAHIPGSLKNRKMRGSYSFKKICRIPRRDLDLEESGRATGGACNSTIQKRERKRRKSRR